MHKNTKRFILASALITTVGGCVSLYFRTGFPSGRGADIPVFLAFSLLTLLPFWISLGLDIRKRSANAVLAFGSLAIGCAGALLYFQMLVVAGKAESVFAVLLVPILQLVGFCVIWAFAKSIERDPYAM